MAKKENKNIHEITVKIEGDSWTKALDKVFKEKQKTVKVDGFRKGKVPRSVFEKKFGKESLYFDAANAVLQEAYLKVMEDSKLIPVVQPAVDIKDITEDGVEFIFKIVTKPDVKVKKYKGLGDKKKKVKVTKDEIDHEIGHLLERYTELVSKEGKVQAGDVAIIDFEGFKDGVAFDGGKGENYSLEIGSNTFIPGFEEQVIGMKAGEEKDINVTFPEDYGAKELAGAPVVFKVKVNEVKEKKQRELDEDFFEDLGMDDIDSEEKLRIPEEMVEEEVDRLMTRFEEQMKMQGISLDVYYQFTNSTEKDLRAQMEKEAYNNVLYRLMLEEVMKLEKIEVSLKEAEKEAEELAKKYQMEKEEFLKQFGGLELVQYDLEMRKVIDVLPGGKFKVELENGFTVEAHVSGKIRMNNIRILPGDTVVLELSPSDITHGRIIWNKR